MSKINILEPAVFNKIAAGEVVERPSSIVKELVENAIDAGSTQISVEVFNGGISKIIVSDNGCGIEKDDIMVAFLPHTTSKIKIAEDLNNITTLGFRGEALASICSVAKVNILTKTKDAVVGNYVKVFGGEVKETGESGAGNGTVVTVEDLFYNVPVRAKFLKKPKQEEGEITSLMARLILSNPNVAIKYIADDEIIYNSQGTGLYDAIFAVYGKNTITNIIPVNSSGFNYELTGYVSKTNFFKPNRTYQTLIINGRYVTDYLVSQAVSRAFEPYMLKQSFPLFVLNLTIPNEELDVNVHPSKKEVRFSNSQQIFGFVYNSVKDAISQFLANSVVEEFKTTSTKTEQITTTPPPSAPMLEQTKRLLDDIKTNATPFVTPTAQDSLKEEAFTPGEILIDKLQNTSFFNEDNTLKHFEPKPIQQQIISNEVLNNDVELSLKVVGKVFNTFVIVETDDIMYLIDQHAAHERMLYDKLVLSVQQKDVKKQGLLIPYTFDVNTNEYSFINQNITVLNDMGFEIEPFGNNSFKVSTIPAQLADLDIGLFFNGILSDLNTFLVLKTEDILKDRLAQYACKHAVKGGDDLNRDELIALVKKVSTGEMTMQCPHGRPFVVEIKRGQIDKWFKRVL